MGTYIACVQVLIKPVDVTASILGLGALTTVVTSMLIKQQDKSE